VDGQVVDSGPGAAAASELSACIAGICRAMSSVAFHPRPHRRTPDRALTGPAMRHNPIADFAALIRQAGFRTTAARDHRGSQTASRPSKSEVRQG
jgi:hypothetical protein